MEGPTSLPSSELWGRKVLDTDGRILGTIDSIARTVGGPVRAIVLVTRRPRHFALVDLSQGLMRGDDVIVPSRVNGPRLEAGSAPSRDFYPLWPAALPRRA